MKLKLCPDPENSATERITERSTMGIVTLLAAPNEITPTGKVKEWCIQISGLDKSDFDTLNVLHPFGKFVQIAGFVSAKWYGKGEGHREAHPPMGNITAIFNHLEKYGYQLPSCSSRCIDTGSDTFKGFLWTLHKPL